MAIKCTKCNRTITRAENHLSCKACKLHFHCDRVTIDEDSYNRLKELGKLNNWFCAFCSISLVSADNPNVVNPETNTSDPKLTPETMKMIDTIVAKHIKPLIDAISELKMTIQDLSTENLNLRNEIGKLNNILPCEQTNFADIDAQNAKTSYRNVVTKNSQKTIIVKPKDDKQSTNKTKFDVMKSVDPLKDVNIGKVKNLKDGGLLLKCDNSFNFKQIAQDKLSASYEIREVKSVGPRIRIAGIPDYIESKDVSSYMKKQNESIFDESSTCNLLKFSPIKKNNTVFQAVFEVDFITYKKALSLVHCLIGLKGCSIYDAIDITRCYNCNTFGHSQKYCKNTVSCPRCGGNHKIVII